MRVVSQIYCAPLPSHRLTCIPQTESRALSHSKFTLCRTRAGPIERVMDERGPPCLGLALSRNLCRLGESRVLSIARRARPRSQQPGVFLVFFGGTSFLDHPSRDPGKQHTRDEQSPRRSRSSMTRRGGGWVGGGQTRDAQSPRSSKSVRDFRLCGRPRTPTGQPAVLPQRQMHLVQAMAPNASGPSDGASRDVARRIKRPSTRLAYLWWLRRHLRV